MGIEVRLISPQYVTPFVKTNKNDRNDAQAIVEAASRPTMNFVAVKSVEQQDIQAVHRVRELLVQQRTALINQTRGLLVERGVSLAQTRQTFKREVPKIVGACEGEVTSVCQAMVLEISQQNHSLEERIKHAEAWLRSFMKQSPLCRKIAAIIDPAIIILKFGMRHHLGVMQATLGAIESAVAPCAAGECMVFPAA